ncbi:ankyrin repeat domain-containing protein [Longimicrobium sp.]|uniref:ankyrin repeat domain-containing protein n=1 Tax=Longimicrobium sp. TaxID=2029185 RepID=UPI002E314727|nr:ankyrin repeat domain-containing protein [Longimicrobium sp.]HEX6040452.1 ankyrin repeat domain-containing protein [Longimicrobium sp.]
MMTTQTTHGTAEVMDAVKAGDADALRAVLARDPAAADARADGDSPLLMALYTGRRDLAELLVAHGRRPDAFEAAAFGDVDRLRALLDAEPGAVTRFAADGWTPLHLAGFFGHVDAMRLLLERGADVRAVSINAMRNTPLHATMAGPSGITGARLLVEAGADVNARQHGGYTALHAAAQHGAIDVIDLLLDHGADPDLPTDDGRRAVDLARERGHADAADHLVRRGASA